jgi:hypothetical protein
MGVRCREPPCELAATERAARRAGLGLSLFGKLEYRARKFSVLFEKETPIDATGPTFGGRIFYNAFLSFLNRRSASIAMGKHTKNVYAMTVPAMTPDTPHD